METGAVITGIGVMTAAGIGKQNFWQGLLSGQSFLTPITRFDTTRFTSSIAGTINNFEARAYLDPRIIAQTDRWTHFDLICAQEALTDAGLSLQDEDPTRIGCVFAAGTGGNEYGQKQLHICWADGPEYVSAYQSIAWFYAASIGQVSIRNKLRGYGRNICAEAAGGLLALAHAAKLVTRGVCDTVIVGAPLPLPEAGATLEELARSDSVRLFADRARAVMPAFSLDESNARHVGAICRRLDGLPLALELAAARSKLLPPAAMLDRLDDLPSSGPRDAPARQRTLAATIEWSYDLLGPEEQRVFVELGVFTGGCTIDAAEAVCNAGLDTLASLVDNSLLRQRAGSDGAPRFTMLETVRRFAADRLDGDDAKRRHADWIVALGEAAQAHWLASGDPVEWLDRIGDELDNVRSALRWALDTGQVETALRLATALRTFWEVRGHFPEGGRWIEEALARDVRVPPEVRGKALSVAGTIAFRTGDLTRAGKHYEEGLEIWRKLDDTEQIARSLSDVGTVAAGVGEFETARKLLHESADVFREIGEDKRLAIVLSNLGHVAGELHDYETAIDVSKEALAIEEQLGRTPNKAITLMNLGTYAQESGDNDGARAWLRRCLNLAVELKYTELMAYALGVAVRLSVAEREFERAARLAGVTDGLLEDAGVPLQTTEAAKFEAAKSAARDRLGDDAYESAHAAGRAADALVEASLF